MKESLSQDLQRQLVRCNAISSGLALLTFCIGGAALLGWILDNKFLKRIHPSLVTMKANTAVCLMLVAFSLFLLQDRSASTAKVRAGKLFGAIVAIVGLITLTEHLFGWNAGIDQLLF